jgi:hypothetical protein
MNEIKSGPPAANADAANSPSTSPFSRVWAPSLGILTFLAYIATLRFQFVHDDRGQILGNPAVHSWHAVPGYFTAHVWAAVAPAFLGNDYRPLFLLWLRINDAIFGHHAAGWHFTTVVSHVVATYCVFLLAHRIFREWPAALFSGLVFGLHPVHIEGVAWISGVPEPLLAALLIPAYLCWVRSREVGGPWLGASLVLYTLALLMKETAVVLLLILFASQWLGFPCPLECQPCGWIQKSLKFLKALVPYFVLTVVYVIVRTVALKGFSHPAARISWLTVVLTWPSLLLFYLKLLVWPVGLSPFYGLQFVSHPTLGNTVIPALVLFLVAGGLWKWASHSRPVALVVPWLIFPVLPVLNVQVFGNGNFAHNRYLYLPSVGFAMLVALALREIKFGRPTLGGIPAFQVGICLGLAMLMGFAIHVEDRYYSSDAAFYSYAYTRMGNKDPVIGMDYANTLAEQGDFEHAAAIYQELIQAHPDMWDACFNLGYMYYQMGQLDAAVLYLERAAAGDPTRAGAAFYLGLADLKLNRMDEAQANLQRAIALAPTTPNYHFALGMVLKVKGDGRGAIADFTRELELNPGHEAAAQQAAEIQRQIVGK